MFHNIAAGGSFFKRKISQINRKCYVLTIHIRITAIKIGVKKDETKIFKILFF